MEDKFTTIINSMDNVPEQYPSYFFKEKVLKAYVASKQKVQKQMSDWFPWLDVKYQLSFIVTIVILNLFVLNYVTKKEAFRSDIDSLSETFNRMPL